MEEELQGIGASSCDDQASRASHQAPTGLDHSATTPCVGTKMLRRSDVIALVAKEIAKQWTVCETASACGNHFRVLHTRSRIDALRIVRNMLHGLPVFIEAEYASDDAIPHGSEWAERVRIAGNLTDAPNAADPAMVRLLADLRVPLAELQELDDEHAEDLERQDAPQC